MLCKIWGFHGGDYEKCRLLEYKNPVRTSEETHCDSATEPSQLMLCMVWGLHGGDCEERLLLGYKNPVRTSQKSHYVSATEPSQLMLRKTWGFRARTIKNGVFWDLKPQGWRVLTGTGVQNVLQCRTFEYCRRYCLFSRTTFFFCIIGCVRSIVECLSLTTNWWFVINPL
jgi:hypothetical protein